jgi:hypothetical protein
MAHVVGQMPVERIKLSVGKVKLKRVNKVKWGGP